MGEYYVKGYKGELIKETYGQKVYRERKENIKMMCLKR